MTAPKDCYVSLQTQIDPGPRPRLQNGPFPPNMTSQDPILFLVMMFFPLGELVRQKGWSALTTLSAVVREVPVFLLDYVICKISRFSDLRKTEAE